MQIKVEKIRAILSLLQPVVPKKATLPVLTNVLVMDGKLVATDLETSVAVAVQEAQGTFLIPLRSVMDLLKFVPGDEMLTIEPDTSTIKLSWKGGAATYDVKDARDYPPLAVMERKAEGSLHGDMLVDALVAAVPYCSTDETRMVLTGPTLYLGDPVIVTGADGFRLSYQTLKMSYPMQETIIIPRNAVHILEHIWRKSPAAVPMATTLVSQITSVRQLKFCLRKDSTVEVLFGKISMFFKPIEGTPPSYATLLNSFQEPIKVMFMATELLTAARRLANIAEAGSDIVRLMWTDTAMTISAQSAEVGASSAEIPLLSASSPGRIALKVQNLIDYLTGKDGFVTMGTSAPNAPAVFHYGSTPIVAIMPMFVQWDDDKPAEPTSQEPAQEQEQQGETPTDETEGNGEEETPDEENTEPSEEEEPMEPSGEEVTEEKNEPPDPSAEVKPKRRGRPPKKT